MKCLLFSFVLMVGMPIGSDAAALIQDPVTRIEVSTDRGDVVLAEADSLQLKVLSVEIDRKNVRVDVYKYPELEGPYLHSMKIYVDDVKRDGDFVRRIVVPFLRYREIEDVSLVIDVVSAGVLDSRVVKGSDMDRPIHVYP